MECACRVDGLLSDNPLRAQARKCRERLSTIASRGLARRDLTEAEVAALLDTCLSHPDEAVYDAMLLQLLTGLTVPELYGLTVGDWQRGRSVSWIEVTKAYKQVRGQMPAMTKLLDDANSYRKVVCTEAVEQVLHRLVARCKRQSRADRGAPLIAAADGTRLSPQQYKAAVRDVLEKFGQNFLIDTHVLDKIIRDGARLSFVERGGILRGENRPTMAHTDLLRNTAAYYFRMVCRCNDAERAAILGLHQEHTVGAVYVDWGNEQVLLQLQGKLARWHSRILHTTEEIQLGQSGCQLLIRAQPESHLTVCSRHGVIGTIKKREEL